jgi:eukaryotic-like serine/threonine-protein kinase
MPLAANSRLGHYEIKSSLGVGGMGEVYRAHDSRLDRDVAIKVLRSDSAATPDLKARFDREARAVAALNHPNIVAVFDFGVDQLAGVESQYIVSELVDGESLRQVIAGKAVAIRRLVDIAVQVADGLAAAHAAGIVHRDLKPENILLTKDARAKILDFGLARQSAKSVAVKDSDETFAPDSKENLTDAGTILGTASYMSPEQAVGKPMDYRSDQFSFGLIVHEMATGKQAFARKSGVETMAAIVRDEPPAIEEKLPAPLRWIIGRCLAKEPEQRYESTRDLYQELKNLREHFSEAYSSSDLLTPVPIKLRTVRWKLLAGVATCALFAGALISYLLKPYGTDLGNYRYTPLASDAGTAVWAPDGTAIAYSGQVNDTGQVFLRYLNSPAPVQLTHGAHSMWPLGWSSDRSHLIIAEDHRYDSPDIKIYSVATVGGQPDFIMNAQCRVCAVSSDGKALATLVKRDDGYYGVAISDPLGSPLKTYTPEPFASKELYQEAQISFSPDGKSILLCRLGHKAVNEFWRLPYPAGSDAPQRIHINAQAMRMNARGAWMPDNKHILITFATSSPGSHLAIAEAGSNDLRMLTAGTLSESEPIASPDGKTIIFTQDGSRGEVISVSLEDGSTKTLVSTASIETAPTWSATNAKLVWISYRSGHNQIWVRMPDGSERPVVTTADFPLEIPFFLNPSLAPDGDRVIYPAWNGQGLWLWISSLSGGAPIRLTNAQQEFEYGGAWSPDESRFAYTQVKNSRLSLMIVRTSGNAAPITLNNHVEYFLPDWSPAGDWITYRDSTGWNMVSPDGKTTKSLGKIDTPYLTFSKDSKLLYGIQIAEGEADPDRATLFSLDPRTLNRRVIKELGKAFIPSSPFRPIRFSLAPDGKSLVYSTLKEQHDLWMLQGYRQPGWWDQMTSAFTSKQER